MAQLFVYTFETGLILVAGYLIYKCIMAPLKQPALNRFTILTIMAVAMLWPVYHSGINSLLISATSPAVMAEVGALQPGIVTATPQAPPVWPRIVLIIYIAGMILTSARLIAGVIKISSLIRRGKKTNIAGYTVVLLSDTSIAPFSWGRYIVMSSADYHSDPQVILTHELAHIRALHTLDLSVMHLLCILYWYNPAIWLLLDELKTVHEYQADRCVLASGADARTYQLLLIKKAAGTRFRSLANSLHCKLKSRITMMQKSKPRRFSRLAGLAVAMAPVVALAVLRIPPVSAAVNALNATTLNTTRVEAPAPVQAPAESKVSEISQESHFAEYPGGEAAMMEFLYSQLRYPAEALENNEQGTVILQFTVNTDGSISDIKVVRSVSPALDSEAIRVTSKMPRWQPAVENGKAVAVGYTLPVKFKLQDKGSAAPAEPAETTAAPSEKQLPQFPGGENALMNWVASHLRYPVEAIENNEQGTVIVQFTINTDGTVSDVKAARTVTPALDQEAIRVVSEMPKWQPAMENGQPVAVSYALPVRFKLAPKEPQAE